MNKKSLSITLIGLAFTVSSLAQCNELSINELLLLNRTSNKQIVEAFLFERGFAFKDKGLNEDWLSYRYVSIELEMMIEYSEAIMDNELLTMINLYLKEGSKDSFLTNLYKNGWVKFRSEILDKKGWINQSYTNPKIPGSSVIFGRTNSEGSIYYRVIL